MEHSLRPAGVADDGVLGATVVPDDEIAGVPPVAVGELDAGCLGIQELQQRLALDCAPAVEPSRVVPVDEQRFLARLRMDANDWMDRGDRCLLYTSDAADE